MLHKSSKTIHFVAWNEVSVNLGRKKDAEVAINAGLDNRTRKLFKVFIMLGWKKLHKYYALLTSAAYRRRCL
jgi:hypothetical protein